jgi:hypothetical protein
MASIEVPCLSVFGHQLSAGERSHLREHVSAVQLEEWPDRGHLVHLAEPDRFAARLRAFIEHCRTSGERPGGFTADAEHDVAGRPGPPLRGGEQIRAFYRALLIDLEIAAGCVT